MSSFRAVRFLFAPLAAVLIVLALGLSAWALTPAKKPRKPAAARPKPYVKKPIPSGPNAYTSEKFLLARKEFFTRVIVGDYKAAGQHDAKWDAQAEEFLTSFVARITEQKGAPTETALVDQGKKVVELGCSDPMVLLCYGEALFSAQKTKEATSVLEQSLEGFKKSSYHKAYARRAPLTLAYLKDTSRALAPEVKALYDLALEWTLQSMNDGSYGPKDQRMAVCSAFSPGKRGSNVGLKWSELLAAIAKNPPKDPYVFRVIAGNARVNAAWEARGRGWASEVSEEGWEGFESHLKAARKLLTEAWKLHPEYPEAPTVMISVVMGGGRVPGETERTWFDRAVAAQMDVDDAYQCLMLSMLPRWDGDLDELYSFGIECVQTGRFDTRVPMMFISALGRVSNNEDGDKAYWTTPKTTKYLKIMFDGYASSDGRFGSPEYIRSWEAVMAWSCYRYSDAKAIVDKLGDKAQMDMFLRSTKDGYVDIREDICALGGPQGAEMIRAAELEKKKNDTEALAIYEKATPEVASDKLAAAYVKRKIDLLKKGWPKG